jgi:hypothetical protein
MGRHQTAKGCQSTMSQTTTRVCKPDKRLTKRTRGLHIHTYSNHSLNSLKSYLSPNSQQKTTNQRTNEPRNTSKSVLLKTSTSLQLCVVDARTRHTATLTCPAARCTTCRDRHTHYRQRECQRERRHHQLTTVRLQPSATLTPSLLLPPASSPTRYDPP